MAKEDSLLGLLQAIGRQATGAGEAGATLASGLISSLVGMPYGVYKGVTSDKYGTPEGVRLAEQEAADFIARNTYTPRTEEGQNMLGLLGKAVDASKVAPIGDLSMLAGIQGGMSRAAAARLADDFQQYNQQLAVPGASYAVKIGPTNSVELMFPGRTEASLSGVEKSALTRFEKSLKNPAVMRRERIAVEGGGDIIDRTPGETYITPQGVNPEQLLGKFVVPVMSDWSGSGETIRQVQGVPLSRPVRKQGGVMYPTLEQNMLENVGWASMPSAASSKTNNLNAYAGLGDTVGVSSLLGPESSNFSHHIAEGLIGQLDTLKPSKAAIKQFNTAVQNLPVVKKDASGKSIKTTPFKSFPGVDSENIWDLMQYGSNDFSAGDIRKAISQVMAKAEFRDLGFPRWQTLTDLVNRPEAYTGATGEMMFAARPEGRIMSPSYSHGSYSSGIPTTGVIGGILNSQNKVQSVPDYLMFRRTFDRLRGQGKTDANIRTSLLKSHHGEQVDEQTIEGLRKYLGYEP